MNTTKQEQASRITAHISGPISGQVAIGNGNHQEQRTQNFYHSEEFALAKLADACAALKSEVRFHAPAEKKAAAQEQVDKLHEAATKKEPDLDSMERVQRWFIKNLPGLAGAVASLVVHPVVGKLVEVSGEALAGELRQRFGLTGK